MTHFHQRRRELLGERRRKPRRDAGQCSRKRKYVRLPRRAPAGVLSSRRATFAARRLAQAMGFA